MNHYHVHIFYPESPDIVTSIKLSVHHDPDYVRGLILSTMYELYRLNSVPIPDLGFKFTIVWQEERRVYSIGDESYRIAEVNMNLDEDGLTEKIVFIFSLTNGMTLFHTVPEKPLDML